MKPTLILSKLLILYFFKKKKNYYRKEDGEAVGASTGVLDLIKLASGLAMLSFFLNQW